MADKRERKGEGREDALFLLTDRHGHKITREQTLAHLPLTVHVISFIRVGPVALYVKAEEQCQSPI